MNWLLNGFLTFLIIAGVIFIIVKMKEEEEPYYAFKIIGYYFIGSFRFSFNSISIPLGFLIFLLFLRNPEKNQRGKRYAAILGLFAFALTLLIPIITNMYDERIRYVEPISTNIYEMNFQNEWKKVVQVLGLEPNETKTARLEHLMIDYEKDGSIKTFRYEVTWKKEGQIHHATIHFHEGKKKITVKATKVDQWLQYDRLISADNLFEKLDHIHIQYLTPNAYFPYYSLECSGEWANYHVMEGETYIIEGTDIIPYANETPLEGYWLRTFGMQQIEEHVFSSTNQNYYLLPERNE